MIFDEWEGLKGLQKSYCNSADDLIIVQGNELTSDLVYDSFQLSSLSQIFELTRQQRDEEYDELLFLKRSIKKDVMDGSRLGFGLVKALEENTNICAVIDEQEEGHQSILRKRNLLLKIFDVMDPSFVMITHLEEEAFKQLQRGECGVIYGSDLSLGRLYMAGKSAGYEMEFLPLWISPRVVETEQNRIKQLELEKQQALAKNAQSIENQEKLAEQAEVETEKKTRENANIQQRKLREDNGLRFMVLKDELQIQIFAAIDFAFQNSKSDQGYAATYLSQIFVDENTKESPYDLIIETIQKLALEGWEITEKRIDQVDFGTVTFNDRDIEGLIVEMKVANKNRLIGKFSEYCQRIHVMHDEDFDMWRNYEITECMDELFSNNWQKNWNFQSKWIVEGAD